MKLKHIISRLNSDYYACLFKEIQSVDSESQDRWKLTARIGDDKYNDSRREHLLRVLWKHIRDMQGLHGFDFTFHSAWLECEIKVKVSSNINDWYSWCRCKELKFVAWFNSTDNIALEKIMYKLNWDGLLKIDLHREDDIKSIKAKVEAKIKEYFYPSMSIFGKVQQLYGDKNKASAKQTYKLLLQKEKEARVDYCHDEVRRALERRFNVEIWVDNLRKVGDMLAKSGIKYKEKTPIERYDYSWIFDFDGDCDELEVEFYESVDNQIIYI